MFEINHGKSKMICRVTILILLILVFTEQMSFADTPVVNPGIDLLNEAVRFYISFEGKSLQADMALGSPKPVNFSGKAEFRPGKYGWSLLTGGKHGRINFLARENLDLSRPGALSFWVAPENWYSREEHNARPYLHFFKTRGRKAGAFMVQRQGFSKKPKRGDLLWAGCAAMTGVGTKGVVRYGTLNWKKEDWHFIIFNWDRRGIAMSVDGSPFRRTDFLRPLPDELVGLVSDKHLFSVGNNNKERTLLDEFVIYNRPLKSEEAAQLYKIKPTRGLITPRKETPLP